MAAILKSNMAAAQNVFCSIGLQRSKIEIYFLAAAPTFVGSRKQMGRFINCFTVVILKFKMATILVLIWSITLSLQRIVIVQLPGSQSGNRGKHRFFFIVLGSHETTDEI